MKQNTPKSVSARTQVHRDSELDQKDYTSRSNPSTQKKVPNYIREIILRSSMIKKSDIIINVNPENNMESVEQLNFKCNICEIEFEDGEKAKLSNNCEHYYCRNCLLGYVTIKTNSFSQVECPQGSCHEKMDNKTEFYQTLNKQTQQRYVKIILFFQTCKNQNQRLCPLETCNEGVIELIENQPVVCSSCKMEFCHNCLSKKHSGSCDKHHREIYQQNFSYKRCKKCKMMVQKSNGCDHMTCRCGNSFCYKCGNPWSSGHFCFEKTCPGITKLHPLLKLPLKIVLVLGGFLIALVFLLAFPILLFLYLILASFGFYTGIIRQICNRGQLCLVLITILGFPIGWLGSIFLVICQERCKFCKAAAQMFCKISSFLCDAALF